MGLEADQRSAATAMGATSLDAAGVDAEIATLEYAEARGGLPQFIAASRPFCEACRKEIEGRGGYITSPTTAIFPRNIPPVAFRLR